MMANMAQEQFGLVIRASKKQTFHQQNPGKKNGEEMLSAATIFLQKRVDKSEEQGVRINREKHL